MTGGKVDLSALGFGMGDVVLLELLKSRGLLPKFDARVDIFCLIEDESLRLESMGVVEDLRQAGCVVEYSISPMKGDKQFKRARELSAAYTVRVQRVAEGNRVCVKNLSTREETLDSITDKNVWMSRIANRSAV